MRSGIFTTSEKGLSFITENLWVTVLIVVLVSFKKLIEQYSTSLLDFP
jgi:hypothetical protein